MKLLRKIVSFVGVAALALAGLVMPVSAASTVEDAEQSVVLIVSEDNGELIGLASGFAVGKVGEDPKYIVTNCHAITFPGTSTVVGNIQVYFSAAANKVMSAEVIAVDTGKDLCVLELPEPTSERKPISLCKSDSVSNGDEVYALGYPAYSFAGKNYLSLDVNDIASTKGSISQKTRVNNSGAVGTNVYLTDATIDEGNSGGPMINEAGEVIGINAWGINSDATNGGYSVMVDELLPLLNANGIPYTIGSAGADANVSTEATEGADPETPAAPDHTMMIVIAAAVVIVVIVIAVVLVVKKKSRPAGKQYAQAVQSQAQAAHGAVIIGMKGLMANRSFSINGSIILGRNAQKCNVCFPVNAQGISGVHCQIRQAGNGYEIIDLGSSNGTYLGSGQKLTPNVPTALPDGTYFYLGSAEQLFQIKY